MQILVFGRKTALIRILIASIGVTFASRVIAQTNDNATNVCNRQMVMKDEFGRLLNHFEYAQADAQSLTRLKSSTRRGCKLIAKDMHNDLMALLSAGQEPTNGGLYALSCFRSIDDQEQIFCDKALKRGISIEERALQSAPKGHSEHATGFAIDFGDKKHRRANLEQDFETTPSGKWLAGNAHRYGFELSFPKNNNQGIAYEPWHWRWVGDGKRKASQKARLIFAKTRDVYPPLNPIKYGNVTKEPIAQQLNFHTNASNLVPRIANKGPGLNPLKIDDDDFIRLRQSNIWHGLEVRRETFEDVNANWAIWRINNRLRNDGPLWLNVHDNENAAFPAALYALKRYGGTAVFVDTGPRDTERNARMNRDLKKGRPIDPNRHFAAGSIYTKRILKDIGNPPRLIISIHTNSKGYDGNSSDCNKENEEAYGRGVISALYCDETMKPFKSKSGRFPFDDNDNIAIIPFRNTMNRKSAFCAKALMKADFNIGFEKVSKKSDGSLSNYALYKGIDYINLEALDRGSKETEIKEAEIAATAMIDYVMKLCRR